jgi:hypothetical protein
MTDFGPAKGDDAGLTATGDIIGTLRCMAPERFHGEGDARADTMASAHGLQTECGHQTPSTLDQALLRHLENLHRQLRVGHHARHGQRADHRRCRDQGSSSRNIGRNLAELTGHDLDELQ